MTIFCFFLQPGLLVGGTVLGPPHLVFSAGEMNVRRMYLRKVNQCLLNLILVCLSISLNGCLESSADANGTMVHADRIAEGGVGDGDTGAGDSASETLGSFLDAELDAFSISDLDPTQHPIDAMYSPAGDAGGEEDGGGVADAEVLRDGHLCEIDIETCPLHSATGETRSPIVLVHGFMGWGAHPWLDYFFGISSELSDLGYAVFTAQLSPVQSTVLRANELLESIESMVRCSCTGKVNLVAHSQGGLDSRYIVDVLGADNLVESITTIASPHHGFELADAAMENRGQGLEFVSSLVAILATLGLDAPLNEQNLRATLSSMTIANRTEYNDTYPPHQAVPVYSIAGFTGWLTERPDFCERGLWPSPRRGDVVEPALWSSYLLLGGSSTPNDGVVPTESCIWDQFLGCVAADHWDQIGQVAGITGTFRYKDLYQKIGAFLKDQGH